MSKISITGTNANTAHISGSNSDVAAASIKRLMINRLDDSGDKVSEARNKIMEESYKTLRDNNIDHTNIINVLKHLTPDKDFEKITKDLSKLEIKYEIKNMVEGCVENVIKSVSSEVLQKAETELDLSVSSESSKIKGKSILLQAPMIELREKTVHSVIESTYRGIANPDGVMDIDRQKQAFIKAGINFIEERAPEPGLTYNCKKNFDVDGLSFKANEKCVLRKVGNDNYEIFKLNEKGSIDGKKKTITGAELANLEQMEKFTPLGNKSRALFPRGIPNSSDISQGAIGDCFLIASLDSIVRKNPQQIYNMVKDNDDGTVTVRLFKVEGSGSNKTFTPKFITFDKSLPESGKHAQGANWLQMLEKAYACEKGSYAHIADGGSMDDIFEVFVGKPAQRVDFDHTSETRHLLSDLVNDHNSLYPAYKVNSSTYDNLIQSVKSDNRFSNEDQLVISGRKQLFLMMSETAPVNDSTLKTFYEQVKNMMGLVDDVSEKAVALKTMLNDTFKNPDQNIVNKNGQWENLMSNKLFQDFKDQKLQPILDKAKYGGQVRLEEVLNAFNTHALEVPKFKELIDNKTNSPLINDFKNLLALNLPGKRFSKIYSEAQVQLYDQIKDKFDKGEYIGMGSKISVGRKIDGNGYSSGEPVSKGLVGKHAFAVTGIKEENGVKYIEIANPWGDTNRTYDKDNNPVKTTSATSWIELSDISKRFNSLYFTK